MKVGMSTKEQAGKTRMNTLTGKCIVSSLILNDNDMNETLGAFALMRDETQSWGKLRESLTEKGCVITPVDNTQNVNNTTDWEIRHNSSLNKVELYGYIKNILVDFTENNNLTASEDIYKVGIGNQIIFTLQSK